MLQRLKMWLVTVPGLSVVLLAPLSMALVPQPVLAAAPTAKDSVCAGLDSTGGTAGCKPSGPTVENAIKLALNLLSLVAGVATVFMVVIAGVRYITSGGDANSVKGAKEAIIYALVGAVIVVVSQSIVGLILNNPKLK